MADPRDLAQKAISLMQKALASSEARADELSEELARKPVSKDKLANKVEMLSHRLASAEEERERWQREAAQLEEVLANERVKLESLKKKLEIAESGPDKLTKKEINYWRANAEKVEEQIAAYKARIGALKRELREKDEQLTGGRPHAEATHAADGANADDAAHAEAEIESLRQQIAGLNAVLADAHAQRQRLESDAADLRARLDAADQRRMETPAQADPARANELAQAKKDNAELRASIQMSEAELHDLRRSREDLAAEVAALKRQLDSDEGRTKDYERQQQLVAAQLAEARTREAALQSELAAAREALAERELFDGQDSSSVTDELKAELDKAKQEAAELRTSLERAQTELADLRDAREGLAAELAELQRRIETEQTEAQERTSRHETMAAELEEVRTREAELRAELNERSRAIAGQQETTHQLNNAVTKAEQKAEEALNQVAELQAELKEEKEYSENLSEQANSRLDQVNKLQDKVEEAEERLNDALWRLEKASHFERLVNRRKGLIASLIDALRTKNKAMVALKAGIDSLRTHKALVEETQQKLLVRMETLKTELTAAKEKIKGLEAEAATISTRDLSENHSDIETLQKRLDTQAELIQSLEDELKTAKAFSRDVEEKDSEVSQLQEELETKNAIIARLQSDLDEQQRKLAKLRGSDGETMRLKAVTEQDKSRIDVLERENTELRAMIESAEQANAGGGAMTDERETELQARIAELTESVAKWKKKYEFVSTEAPAAYQSQTVAEQ